MRRGDPDSPGDLVQLVVGPAYGGNLCDQARFEDYALDLGRRDVFGANLQHVLGSVGEREVTVGVDRDPVTCPEPASLVEAVRGRRRLVEVLGKERQAGRSLDEEGAGLLGLSGRDTVVPYDRDLVLGGGAAHRHRTVRRIRVPDD